MIEGRDLKTDTWFFLSDGDRAEHDVKVKAEVGVRFPQTREQQGPPGAGQGEEDSP